MLKLGIKGAVLLALASLAAQSVAAQNFDQSGQGSEPTLKDLAAEFNIPENSKHMARLQAEMSRPDNDDEDKTPPHQDLGVVKHLRGNKGIAFDRELQQKPVIKSMKEEDMKAIAEKAVELSQMYGESMFQGKDLDACQEDRVERVQLDINDRDLNKIALVDTLFIDAKDVPPNAQSIFGESVDIRTYAKKAGNAAYYSAFGYGVTCLPTRIIITGKQVVRYEGEPALRNYDKNPNGKGAKVKIDEK